MRVDPPTGQQSKTYCKGDSQLVQEKENKGVGITRPITRLELNRTFVEFVETEVSPASPPPESSTFEDCLFKRMGQNRPWTM